MGVERSLASIAPEGWLPVAAAMLGTVDKPSMWGLPPSCLLGRNCSCSRVGNSGIQPVSRALPYPNGLLESKWSMDRMGLVPTYLKQNFNVQEAADLYQAAHLGNLERPCGEWPSL